MRLGQYRYLKFCREVNACIYTSKQPNWGGSIWLSEEADAGPRAVGFAVHNTKDIRAVDAPGGLPSVEAGVRQLVPTGVLVDAVLDRHTLYASSGTIELTDVEADMHHVHKELVGVVLSVASRQFELENKRVCLLVDSTTSVAYIANWGGPSITCNRIVRRLWGICARFGIRIVQVSHIAGSVMITSGVDALSRPYKFARGSEADRDDWRLCDHAFQWLQQVAGVVFTVDRMASRANRRCTQFCSQSSVDPESFGVSAFAVDWTVDSVGAPAVNYCFPPLLDDTLGTTASSGVPGMGNRDFTVLAFTVLVGGNVLDVCDNLVFSAQGSVRACTRWSVARDQATLFLDDCLPT